MSVQGIILACLKQSLRYICVQNTWVSVYRHSLNSSNNVMCRVLN